MDTKNIFNITSYSYLVSAAANQIYNILKNSSYSDTELVKYTFNFTTGSTKDASPTTNIPVNFNMPMSAYTAPSLDKIKNDLLKFFISLGIKTDDSKPDQAGFVSFINALTFFMNKAIIKRVYNITYNKYHLYYNADRVLNYKKLKTSYQPLGFITEDQITDLYEQAATTSLIQGDPSAVSSSDSLSSSSCSSSSCSSSSSSQFIAYLKI